MKRRSPRIAVLALLFCGAGQAAAQSHSIWLAGAGLSLPAAAFATYANAGWDAVIGWEHRFGQHPVAWRVDGSYGANSDNTNIGFHERTTLLTGTVNLVYHFDGAKPHLYALVGAGYFRQHFSSDDPAATPVTVSQLALQVGEGLVFRAGSVALFIEGRLVTSFGPNRLRFFPVVAGVRLGSSRK